MADPCFRLEAFRCRDSSGACGLAVMVFLFVDAPVIHDPFLGIPTVGILSNDASQYYFADGMTDELITHLGQIGAIRVISRTSAMTYRNARKPLAAIARELNV